MMRALDKVGRWALRKEENKTRIVLNRDELVILPVCVEFMFKMPKMKD